MAPPVLHASPMNRRRFVSRLAAGVFAAAMVENALLGRLFEPEPVVTAVDFTLDSGIRHNVEFMYFGGSGRTWMIADGRRVDFPPMLLNDGDEIDVTTTFKRAG